MELMLLVQLYGLDSMAELKPTTPQVTAITATLTEVWECTDPIADSYGRQLRNTPCMVEWSRFYGNKRCMENHTVNSYELKSMADTCT